MKIQASLKFFLILLSAVILYIVAYQVAFKQTYTLYSENTKQREQLNNADSLPSFIYKMEQAIKCLDKKTGKDTLSSIGIQQQTIDFVTSHNQNIRLEETSTPVFTDNGKYTSETVSVMLSGSYHDLLQLLYSMEFSNVNGRIISCRFESVDLLLEKRKKLMLNLYVQNIKWKKN